MLLTVPKQSPSFLFYHVWWSISVENSRSRHHLVCLLALHRIKSAGSPGQCSTCYLRRLPIGHPQPHQMDHGASASTPRHSGTIAGRSHGTYLRYSCRFRHFALLAHGGKTLWWGWRPCHVMALEALLCAGSQRVVGLAYPCMLHCTHGRY